MCTFQNIYVNPHENRLWSTHLVASKGVVDLCNNHKTIKTLSIPRKLGQGSFLVPRGDVGVEYVLSTPLRVVRGD